VANLSRKGHRMTQATAELDLMYLFKYEINTIIKTNQKSKIRYSPENTEVN
jgi:hypothetical protein